MESTPRTHGEKILILSTVAVLIVAALIYWGIRSAREPGEALTPEIVEKYTDAEPKPAPVLPGEVRAQYEDGNASASVPPEVLELYSDAN